MNPCIHKHKVISLSFAIGCGWLALIVFMGLLTAPALGDSQSPALLTAPVAITQEAPDTVFAGDVLTYTVWVSNVSGSTVEGMVLHDTWTTSLYDDRAAWWQRGVLAQFNGYVTDPPGAVLSVTRALLPDRKRGEAFFTMAPLPAGESVQVIFSVTVPITVQPSLGEHEPFRQIMGPTSLENSIIAKVPDQPTAEAPLVSSMVMGPVLRMEKSALGEVAGEDAARIGRLVTYTVQLQNLQSDGTTRARPDAYPATNLVVTERLPDSVATAFVTGTASVPGVLVEHNAGVITWAFPPEYALQPGQTTHMTFTLRIPRDHAYSTNESVTNRRRDLLAQAAGMPHHPASALRDLRVSIYGPLDKVVETAPVLRADETFPNRVITYTLTFYNPYHDQAFSDVLLEDVLPVPFSYTQVITGPAPDVIREENSILEWHDQSVAANGIWQVVYEAFIPPQTPPTACTSEKYLSAVTAKSASAPFEYYAYSNRNETAEVKVIAAIVLRKTVSPRDQIPGELVTYNVVVENQSDRTVPLTILTDTLPMENAETFFSFYEMVEPTAPPYAPDEVVDNIARWDAIPSLAPGEELAFAFRALVDGRAGKRYPNELTAYNPDTAICPLSSQSISRRAPVNVESPIRINKKALLSPVVQGEITQYEVTLYNNSPSTTYDLLNLIDNLDSVRFTDPATGKDYYVYTPTAPIPLEPGESWEHIFEVEATGLGLGTSWCDARGGSNRNLEQLEGRVGVVFGDPPILGFNATKLAPIKVIPHISLIQEAYPNPVAIGSTTVLTLMLQDNRPVPTPTTGIQLSWADPSRGVLSVTESFPPYDSVENNVYYWDDLVVDERAVVTLTLLAPNTVDNDRESRNYSAWARVEAIDDPDICIPPERYSINVRRGIEITKRPNLSTVSPYNEVEYTLRAHNLTGAPVAGVVLTDVLPFGWEFVGWVSGPEPVSEDPLVWHLDTIPAESFVEIKFRVRSYIMVGMQVNEVVGFAPINLGYSHRYTDDVEVMVISGIGLFKEVADDVVNVGNTTIYTLTMYNGSNVDLDNIVVVDTLPQGFTYVEGIQQPVAPSIEREGEREVLTWIVPGDLSTNRSLVFEFRVRVEEDVPSGYYFNAATGEAYNQNTGEAREVPPTGPTARVWVSGASTVLADKTVAPTAVYAGDDVTYTITLFNEMDDTQSLVLTDTLPPGFEFVSADIAPAEVLSGTSARVVWRDLSIGPEETLDITLRARTDVLAETGSYCNQIQVQAGTFVLPPSLPIACVNVTELPGVDAQISLEDGVEVAQAGDTFNYVVTYANAEDAELTLYDVGITKTLTPFEYVTAADNNWDDLGNGQYLYTVGELAPGESGQVNFTVKLADTIPEDVLSFRNEAEIGYTTEIRSVDVNPADNVAVDVNIFRALFKTVSHPAINAGWDVVYTITLHNTMPQPWHDVRIEDSLPEDFTFKQMLVGPAPDAHSNPHHPTWLVDEVPGDSVLTFTFQATIGLDVPTGEYDNQVTGSAARGETQFDLPPTGPTAPVSVRGAPAVQITKEAAPQALDAGESLVYTLTLHSAAAQSFPVVLTDILPSDFRFVDSLSAPEFTHLPGEREKIIWEDLQLEPGGTLEVAFLTEVDSIARTANYCNGVQALVGDFLYPVLELACVAVEGLFSPVDLHITQQDGVTEVIPRDFLTYTIHYTNSALSSPLTNVVFTQTFTPPTALLGLNPEWTQVREGVYAYSLGDLESEITGSVVLTGQVNPAMSPQILTMSSHIESGFSTVKEPLILHPEQLSVTDINTILHGPDLVVLNARLSPAVPGAGAPFRVFARIKNQGTLPTRRWDDSDDWWHYVARVYLLSPDAPAPTGVFDNEGEICLVWGGILQPGQTFEIECSDIPVAPAIGTYALYVQADVTWNADPPWGQDFGLVKETRENNNVYSGGYIEIAESAEYAHAIYLPLVLRAPR